MGGSIKPTNNYCNFYWTGDATNLPVSCTEVIYGQTNTVTATLNVQKPSATISSEHGIIAVDAGNYDTTTSGTIDTSTLLHFGSVLPGATPGMKFGVNASAFPAGANNANNIIWNQLVNSDAYTITAATSSQTATNSGGYDAGNPPDDVYPYSYGNEADDSPGGPSLQTNYTSFTRSFTATMYLMWQPSATLTGGDPRSSTKKSTMVGSEAFYSVRNNEMWGIDKFTIYFHMLDRAL